MADAIVKVTIEINPTNNAISASQQAGIDPPTPYKEEFEMKMAKEHFPIRVDVHSVATGADNRPLMESSMVCKD